MRLRGAQKVVQVAQDDAWIEQGRPDDGKDGRRERPKKKHETKNQNTRQRRGREREGKKNDRMRDEGGKSETIRKPAGKR